MYYIIYKNLSTGKCHTVYDNYEAGYNLSMYILSVMQESGIIKIEAHGELKEIENKEENQC